MRKEFNLIKNKSVARAIAIVLISIALVLETVEFAVGAIHFFQFEKLFLFLFDLIANGFILGALFFKNIPLIEVGLIVIKVFDGTYYPLKSSRQLDILINVPNPDALDICEHVLFAIAAFSLLIALFFFCLYKFKGIRHAWDIMKHLLLIAALMMMISIVISSIEFSRGAMNWHEVLEPTFLSILFLGMFATCEYTEEETIYAADQKEK